MRAFKRELPPLIAFAVLLVVMAIKAPAFFQPGNLRDLVLNNALALIVAIGMTLVILVKQIDISVASQFAVCAVAAGLFAKAGVPIALLAPLVAVVGAAMGALNGLLVAFVGLPSIIVTLATFVAWRDGLRWITEGAWVQQLPQNFQWLGLGSFAAQTLIVGVALVLLVLFAWALRALPAGRSIYAVGSNTEAARLAGIDPVRVTFSTYVLLGALVGLAATLNAVRFNSVPSNAGVGLEMKTIAAVVIGGTAISGGRGRLIGTAIGVALLGTIGTALTFVGINPFWEKAIQGAIILAALLSDVAVGRIQSQVRHVGSVSATG